MIFELEFVLRKHQEEVFYLLGPDGHTLTLREASPAVKGKVYKKVGNSNSPQRKLEMSYLLC